MGASVLTLRGKERKKKKCSFFEVLLFWNVSGNGCAGEELLGVKQEDRLIGMLM